MKTIPFKEKYGPHALIAGGSEGLGFAFAEAIARRGLNLVLVARQEDRLNAAAARLKEAYQIDVISMAADMADYEHAKRLIASLNVSIGLFIYNAAFAPIGLFETISEDHLALTTAVNVRTPLLLTRLLSWRALESIHGESEIQDHPFYLLTCGASFHFRVALHIRYDLYHKKDRHYDSPYHRNLPRHYDEPIVHRIVKGQIWNQPFPVFLPVITEINFESMVKQPFH